MSLTNSIKKTLYRSLSLDNYLTVVSRMFFIGYRLGLGKNSPAYEYPRFLKRLVRRGDTVIDIGANLGYYSRILSRLVGAQGKVYAVEPVEPIFNVLWRNVRKCGNVEIMPYALGAEEKCIFLGNNSSRYTGYMGTGRNSVMSLDEYENAEVKFRAEMYRGSELFRGLTRLDFIKCDIEGYETVVIPEMSPVIERFMPVVLIETGGPNRREILELFRGWGYAGYVLKNGRLVSLMREEGDKDIVFIPGHRHDELKHLIEE